MQVPVDDELPETACDFVHARGARFNEGVMGEKVRMRRSKGQGRDLNYTVLQYLYWIVWFMFLFMFMLCQGGIEYVRSNLFDWGFVTASGTWYAIAHACEEGYSEVGKNGNLPSSRRWKRFPMWRSFFYMGKIHTQIKYFINGELDMKIVYHSCWMPIPTHFRNHNPETLPAKNAESKTQNDTPCNENLEFFSMPLGDSSLAYALACNSRLLDLGLFLTCWTRCGFQRVCGVGETWLQNKYGVDVFVKKNLVTSQNRGPPPWRCVFFVWTLGKISVSTGSDLWNSVYQIIMECLIKLRV